VLKFNDGHTPKVSFEEEKYLQTTPSGNDAISSVTSDTAAGEIYFLIQSQVFAKPNGQAS
jgi:hypothetical protein